MKVRAPRAQVRLYKLRSRTSLWGTATTPSTRYAGVQQIDVTSHLSDVGFRTQRTISDPNGGTFQLVFDDKPVVAGGVNLGDSLYGLIEPMDFVEIRAAGTPSAQALPLIMRGFVKSVQEDGDIDSGQPSRKVVVSGFDIAHVLQILRVRYSASGVTPQLAQQLTEQYGIPFGVSPLAMFEAATQFSGPSSNARTAAQLIDDVLTVLVRPYLAKLFGGNTALSSAATIFGNCSIVNGLVPPLQAAEAFDGRSIYEVLAEVLDVGTFNELFVDDQDSQLVLTARPLPYSDPDGTPIGDALPGTPYTVDAGSLIRWSATRTDAGVANYYWVQRRLDLINDGLRSLVGAAGPDDSFLLAGYDNANPTAYGWRLMQAQTALTNQSAAVLAPSADGNYPRQVSEEQWLADRRELLMALNRDNVVLERGTLRLMGDENIRAGTTLLIQRGPSLVRLYAESVAHEFSQRTGFVTTVGFTRGTGWIARARAEGLPWYLLRNENGVS